MRLDQAIPYVGIPYGEGAEGPDRYNCWGLLRHIQRVYFNRELPAVIIGDVAATKAMHDAASHNGQYWIVDFPIHGDAVLMRAGNDPHVGTWLDFDGGGVLHSMVGVGVVFTPKRNIRELGFSRLKYYRIRDACPICPPERPVPS